MNSQNRGLTRAGKTSWDLSKSISSRIGPFHFQAGGRRRRPNLALVLLVYYSPEGEYCKYTPWAKRTAFTRSAITPPKFKRIGWNLEPCEPNVGGSPLQILGAIRTVETVWEGAGILFFFLLIFPVNKTHIHPFPVGQILWHQHRSVRRWKLSQQNFENFTINVRFSKKN